MAQVILSLEEYEQLKAKAKAGNELIDKLKQLSYYPYEQRVQISERLLKEIQKQF